MLNATTGVVKRYVEKGHNVLLVGDHGVGKTTLVRDVVKQLGWRMVEFNAALMEPYVDFIGIPMSRKNEDGTEELQMVSKREIFDADLIFVDEFNRGQPATINALMNIINDHQLNGQPLPNLKAVVAACNPPKSSVTGDTYMVGELDPAQVDRFTVHLTMSNEVNEKYLADALGMPNLARELAEWQHSLDFGSENKVARVPYISPRRVERLGRVFVEFPEKETLYHVLGMDADKFPVTSLFHDLYDAYRKDVVGGAEGEMPGATKESGNETPGVAVKSGSEPADDGLGLQVAGKRVVSRRRGAGSTSGAKDISRDIAQDISRQIVSGDIRVEDAYDKLVGMFT